MSNKAAWKYVSDEELQRLSSHKVVVIPTRGCGKDYFMQELFRKFMYRMPYTCSNYYYASCKSYKPCEEVEDVLEYDYYREKIEEI